MKTQPHHYNSLPEKALLKIQALSLTLAQTSMMLVMWEKKGILIEDIYIIIYHQYNRTIWYSDYNRCHPELTSATGGAAKPHYKKPFSSCSKSV
jgi:hypothetical protein